MALGALLQLATIKVNKTLVRKNDAGCWNIPWLYGLRKIERLVVLPDRILKRKPIYF